MDTVTHGVKYLGSKKDLLPYIGDIISGLDAKTAIDVFTGTTRVAQHLRQLGISTSTSDLSWASTHYAATFVHNRGDFNHLLPALVEMNAGQSDGWLTANYSGAGPETDQRADGRCFQPKNTRRADFARDWVQAADLPPEDKSVLITAIIRGLDAVDNTVGVQQAYLKEWCKRSFNDVVFKLPAVVAGPSGHHYEGDCLLIDYQPADVAYLDPPYSPHAYSTYYHIWDSIARWDKPETALKARRRLDRVAKTEGFDEAMTSPWNSSRTALSAFLALVERLPVRDCVISYSDESLVDRHTLLAALSSIGETQVVEVDYRRNIMSQIGNAKVNGDPEKGQQNKELIITVRK